MVATSTKLRITENNADQQNLAKTCKRPVIGDPWGKEGGGGREGCGGKAPFPVTGSLRRFQGENESVNCTVLSGRKKCAHC